MSKPLTTEQKIIIDKCFAFVLCNIQHGKHDYSSIARAARRFVRLENAQSNDLTKCFVVQVEERNGRSFKPVRFTTLSIAKLFLGKTKGTITERVERLVAKPQEREHETIPKH
jgi:hypothetical protein